MGGALILTAIAVSTLLWADLENSYVWIVLFVTLSFGAIGYVDDYKKLVLQDPAGISAAQKLFWQSSAAIIAAIALYVTATDEVQTSLLIPYFKDLAIPLGLFQVVVTYFFMGAASGTRRILLCIMGFWLRCRPGGWGGRRRWRMWCCSWPRRWRSG